MNTDRPRKVPVVFYRTPAGTEVVRNWLRALNEKDSNAVGQDRHRRPPAQPASAGGSRAGSDRVQYRWPIGMPLCRPMGDGLWEVRSELPGNRIARVLFSVQQGKILVLHGFIKKSQKTPAADLALARKRNREFEQ